HYSGDGKRRICRGNGSGNALLRRHQHREGAPLDERDDAHCGGVLNKRLLLLLGVGVVVIGGAIVVVLSGTKGSHLELQGQVLKARTGGLSDTDSVAVLDFRIKNTSDIPFVVRQVKVTLD